jgi:hypothetical protein
MEQDDALYGDGELIDDFSSPAPVPEGIGRVVWHVRKAHVIREQARAERAMFMVEIDRLRERLIDREGFLSRAAEWHERAVESWHRAHVKEVGKTVHFPTGNPSKLRAAQPMVEIVDEDALRVWLAEHDLEERVYPAKEPALSRQKLKEVLAKESKDGVEPGSVLAFVHPETGERVPGVRMRVLPDRWQGTDR